MNDHSKLLVVHSDPAWAQSLGEGLRSKFDCEVDVTTTAEDAGKLITTERYAAALVEMNLPGVALGAVVDDLCHRQIAVIVMTDSLDESIYQQISFRPIADYLVTSMPNAEAAASKAVARLLRNAKRHVLLLEPSTSFRDYLGSMLHDQRLRVTFANDIPETLSNLQSQPDICLAIVDNALEGQSGVSFCAELRQSRASGSFGIVGMSDSPDPFTAVRFFKAGADDVLRKPFLSEEFSSRINSCLDHLDAIQQVRDQANRDYLTGLYNRRYLFDTGETLYQNARRANLNLAVAVIDIDHFKHINDTYGHDIGDQVLVALAGCLSANFRGTDIVARLGGEEFCIMVSNPGDAFTLMERLRQHIAALRIAIPNSKTGALQITVSIGLTTRLNKNLPEMINQADEALYAAKKGGRNRVVIDNLS